MKTNSNFPVETTADRVNKELLQKIPANVGKSKSQKTLVIKLDWWLWRNIAMTWLISAVAKQRPVKVICSRPLAFWWNPFIKSVHGLGDRRLFQDVIKWNDYIEIEPYTDPKFFNDGVNWLEVVRLQLWLDKVYYPEMHLADREEKTYKLDWIKPILFQPFWSTMDINWADKSYRSIPVAQAQYIAEQLMKKWYTVYTCESEKQPELRWVNTLRKVTDLRYMVWLCSKYPVIWCDSCLHHASVWFWKRPIVLRAWTDAWRFWYEWKEDNYREFPMKEYTPMRLFINDFDFDNSNQWTNDFSIEFIDKVLEKL